GVHATLGGNGVGASCDVVVGERLHVVAEFTECRGGGATGQAGADNQDAELATVQWGDQVHVVLVVVPHVLHRHADRLMCIQDGAWGDLRKDGRRVVELRAFSRVSLNAHIYS